MRRAPFCTMLDIDEDRFISFFTAFSTAFMLPPSLVSPPTPSSASTECSELRREREARPKTADRGEPCGFPSGLTLPTDRCFRRL